MTRKYHITKNITGNVSDVSRDCGRIIYRCSYTTDTNWLFQFKLHVWQIVNILLEIHSIANSRRIIIRHLGRLTKFLEFWDADSSWVTRITFRNLRVVFKFRTSFATEVTPDMDYKQLHKGLVFLSSLLTERFCVCPNVLCGQTNFN